MPPPELVAAIAEPPANPAILAEIAPRERRAASRSARASRAVAILVQASPSSRSCPARFPDEQRRPRRGAARVHGGRLPTPLVAAFLRFGRTVRWRAAFQRKIRPPSAGSPPDRARHIGYATGSPSCAVLPTLARGRARCSSRRRRPGLSGRSPPPGRSCPRRCRGDARPDRLPILLSTSASSPGTTTGALALLPRDSPRPRAVSRARRGAPASGAKLRMLVEWLRAGRKPRFGHGGAGVHDARRLGSAATLSCTT